MSNQKSNSKNDPKVETKNDSKTKPFVGGPPMIIECEKVATNNVTFTELDTKNERSANQSLCYPNYEYLPGVKKNFIFKTGAIKLTQYGIPQMTDKTKKWIKSDQDREHFRLPHDPTQPTSVALFKMLSALDKHVLQNQANIFGANAAKYKYIPLVKEPAEAEVDENEEGEDKKKPKYDRFQFCKVKFDTDFGDNRKLTTAIFLREAETGKPLLQEVNSVTEAEEHLPWGSTARFVIMANKLWAAKQTKTKGKGELKEFGLTMKCLQLEVIAKPQKTGSIKTSFRSSYALGDTDGSDTTAVDTPAGNAEKTTQPAAQATEQNKKANSSDEEEEGEVLVDEDEEEEEEQTAPQPTNVKQGKSGARQS